MSFGTFELHLESGDLRKQGRKVRLTDQPLQVLRVLLQHAGQVVTREELQRELWSSDTFVDFETGLNSAIRKLRDALGDSADNPTFIETVPRRGYRFIAPVNRRSERDHSTIITPSPVEPSKTTADLGWLRIRAYRWIGFMFVTAGLIASLILATRNRDIQSVAVSMLQNETGDPAQRYFATGLTDALTTTLAERTGLRVMPRTSMPDYKAGEKALHVIGRELNLDGIVEWTMVRSKDQIRVNVRLLDTRREQYIWGHTFDSHVDDLAALQEDIAQAIAQATGHTLLKHQSGLRVSAHAEDLFFQALTAAGRDTPQGFVDAIKYADAATDEQPDFARAWARKAIWWNQFAFAGGLAPSDFMPKAEHAAREALRLDESISEAHAALGLVLYRFHWDWAGAERELRRSLKLNPSANAHRVLAAFLLARGQRADALREAQIARDLDPLSAQALYNLAEAHREAGQNEQAISEFRTLLSDHPELARAHYQLALSLLAKGDSASAVNELQTAISRSSLRPSYLAHLGYAHAVRGDSAQAWKILGELKAQSEQQFVSPVDLAGIQIGLGLKDSALASLNEACDARDPFVTKLLTDMRMASLRSDSRFQDLLRRIGLPNDTP